MSEQNPTQKTETKGDLLGVDVELPEDLTLMPLPTCAKCGAPVPHFYCRVYKVATPQGVMVLQAYCCPHAACRNLFVVFPVGIEANKVAAPGKAGWPGMPS